MTLGQLYNSQYVKATLPYRMIGDMINDVIGDKNNWEFYKDTIINLCDMIVAYSYNQEECERALNYLEKCIPINTSDELIEWGKPFREFVKQFSKKPYEELEEFCKEASAKLFKEEE